MTAAAMFDLHAGYAEPSAAAAAAGVVDEQRVLLDYAPLVKRIARQLSAQASATLDREDMEQIGLLGLLDAYCRYLGGASDRSYVIIEAVREVVSRDKAFQRSLGKGNAVPEKADAAAGEKAPQAADHNKTKRPAVPVPAVREGAA